MTRVEVGNDGRRERDVGSGQVTDESGKEIFVTTSMTQDVERKSEMGSETSLIIQHS